MEQLRIDSSILHPEVLSVERKSASESLSTARITFPYFSKYEFTALMAIRAQQLADGARPLVSLDGMMTSSPSFIWDVSKKEILERKLPYIIHRRMPNGNSEYWSASELTVVW